MLNVFPALAATPFLLASIGPALAAPIDAMDAIRPHRAVYDMTLGNVAEGSDLATLSGRLAYDLQGTLCEGFSVNFRLVTRFANRNGDETTTDLRSATFEDLLTRGDAEDRFRFLTSNIVNRVASAETDGVAARLDGAVEVTLKKPEEADLVLPGDVLFPTEHLAALIEAARNGVRVFPARIYDGSEDGATVNETTAVIGARAVREDADFPALEGRTYWPVTLSYFEEGATGDLLPEYEISFDLFENGVSDILTLDYGEFSVEGSLATLEMPDTQPSEPDACPPD